MSRKDVLKNFEQNSTENEERINFGIENYRKGDFCIKVEAEDGNVVRDAQIKIVQKSHEFKYGANLFMLDELETEEKNIKYRKYFREAFNMATLPFYWSDLEPERGKTRYEKDSPKIYRRPPIDLCMEFCEENNIEPREHALAYCNFFPKWIEKNNVESIKKDLEKRYKEISQRYADRINTIEVTNETWWYELSEKHDVLNALYQENDFVEYCFKLAEKYFPNNQLAINEYAAVWDSAGTNRDRYYMQIERAIKNGARIDAIGMQFHMFFKKEDELEKTKNYYNPCLANKILDRYSDFDLPIQLTEVTVPAYSYASEDEEVQAEIIKRLYKFWFSHKNVEQIMYWNLVDGYAAYAPQGDMTAGENYYYGGLLRFDLTPKPSYYVIKDLFEKEWHTELKAKTENNGSLCFRGFFGEYEILIEYNNKVYKSTEFFSRKPNTNNIKTIILK